MAADFVDDEFVTEDYNDFDIIIIGAGLTGLTCAYHILRRQAGLNVLIIEIEGIVSDPRFSSYTSHEDAKYLAEISVEQLLRSIIYIPYTRTLCRAFICSTCAMRNLNNVSALWLLVMLNGASGLLNRLKVTTGDSNQYFVEGGMTKLVQALLKEILKEDGKIKYVETVNEIRFNDDRIYVLTEKNNLKCEYVVVTVPPPLQNRIVIEPPSSYTTSLQNLYAAGENVFFNIIYKTPPWNNDQRENIITTWDASTNLNIAYHATHGDTTFVLAGFLADFNTTYKKNLFDVLDECFGNTQARNNVKYDEWSPTFPNVEQTVSSPMSVMKPTSISNHINYIGNSHNRIFFASSEYAANWPGTLDGAVEAGEITAYSILSRIRPQALTFHEISSLTQIDFRLKTQIFYIVLSIIFICTIYICI
ncbi:amine oxidase [flavin-containing] A-like [Ptiloglossa arizonensis]|uniref:amine oxidase [flavin-containing] A-like n=1 Tax=Ptiloglossa arizonensis TaxID=3350558 RepID=UPI003FA08751